ncbi:MAG TPA: CbiX/SirB N-terminal domain-containing protein [Candidatus Desulfaltia sp.]|nr:CbiX/SirB N-terminal domain-containing protein [Candidatus Desulfaltia sp.]
MGDKKMGRPKAVIVLAMHGAPPLDFPREEMTEYMSLHARVGHAPRPDAGAQRQRYEELEAKIRAWPRTGQNDPFYAGSQDLAKQLRRESGLEVIIGFNEFCAPTLDNVLERAAAREAEKIIVVTPMMTRGGEHSAVDIPEAIRRAQQKFPAQKIIYAWPSPTEDIARFLSSQITRFL